MYLLASKILHLAERHCYKAIPDANNLAWEVQDDDTAKFFEQTFPIGHVKLAGKLWKVSAYMVRRTGEIQLRRHGMRLTSSHIALVQLSSPFLHLRKEGGRLRLEHLQALCQYYFLGGGYVMGLKWEHEWLRSLNLACEAVGQGMGMLEKPAPVWGGAGWADEEGEMDY